MRIEKVLFHPLTPEDIRNFVFMMCMLLETFSMRPIPQSERIFPFAI